MVLNSALEDMSTTDESMGANQDDQPETTWETPKPATMASCLTTNSKPVNSQPEKIPLKIPGNVLTTTSVVRAAAAAALASAAAEAAAAAANKNNPITANANSNTSGITDKPYKCDTCEKAFSQRRALKAHKRVHTGEKPYKCDTCPKAFSHQGARKAHKRVHTGERPFKCEVCGMSFSHLSTLLTHKRTHTGEKPFKCDLCGDVFSYRQTMQSHRKKHLADASMPNATGMVVTSTASSTLGIASSAKRQLFKCINCGKDCTSREEFDAHIETHLEKNLFRCFTCNKTFSNCDTLEKHKLTHLTPQAVKSETVLTATNAGLTEKIVVANKDTNGDLSAVHFSSSVSSQQQAQHQQQQQYHHHQQQQQQLPKKKASNNSTLGTNQIHIEERPYKCYICNEGFPTITAQTTHERTHMSFSHLSTLLMHKRTHTGEKPFKCDLCGDVFSYRQTMKSHRKKHLADASMPNATAMVVTSTASSTLGIASAPKRQLFKCINCGKDCTSREEFDAHIETHLEKNLFRCFTCNKTFSNCDTLEKHKLTHLTPQAVKSETVLTATNAGLTEKIVGANKDTNGDLSAPHFSSSVSSPQQAQHQQQQQHHHHHQQQQQQQLPKKKASNNSTLGTNQIHIEERPYKCYICNEGFPTITAQTTHERTHNDDMSVPILSSSLLSSYTSDICGVVFSEKSNLDAHKKMHVHEKPFDYKPITVASQKDYSDSPFECTICGAPFSDADTETHLEKNPFSPKWILLSP